MTPAVFLDRDGTLIEERDFLRRPEDVVLHAGAGPALRRLQSNGFRLFIVSNQSGVGRGYFTMAEVERVNSRVQEEFMRFGVRFEKIYIAPEAPSEPSRGRKPSPQFLFDAQDEIDRRRRQFIADIEDKLQQRASLTALLSTRCRLA